MRRTRGQSPHVLSAASLRDALGLETRGLDALAREEAVDRLSMDAENATDPHRVEAAVVNQPPDRLRMDAELVRDVTDADETPGLFAYRRHNSPEALQVPKTDTWADRTNSELVGA